MMPLGKHALNPNVHFSQIVSLVAIPMNVFSNVFDSSKLFTKIVHVRSVSQQKYVFIFIFIKANCPLGCPCDNYDCDNDESDDDVTINGPISVQEDNFMAKLDYSDNFEISFEYKASSLPSLQSKRNWHQIIIGKFIFFQFKIDI